MSARSRLVGGGRPSRTAVRDLAVGMVAVVAAPMLAPSGPAGPTVPADVAAPPGRSVPVSAVGSRSPEPADTDRAGRWNPGAAQWPAGGNAVVAVDAGSAGAARRAPQPDRAGFGRVGGLPLTLREPGGGAETQARGAAAPSSVRVSVSGRDVADLAGVRGVLFTLVRADGLAGRSRVAVDVDYSGFRYAYGGDYGGRLRLMRLPGCVLSTPDRPQCQAQTPVAGSTNTPAAAAVSADAVEVADGAGAALFAPPKPTDGKDRVRASGAAAPVPAGRGSRPAGSSAGSTVGTTPIAPEPGGQPVYALTSTVSSQAGDYSHTSLAPSYGWAGGSQGGEFTYTIPLAVPPALNGPAPDLALRYSSGSVDGRTTSTNNQVSMVGEGWDLTTSYIERSYRFCRDDTPPNTNGGDLCWFTDKVVTMVFAGRSTRLVKDDATGVWRGASDDGTRIELLSDMGLGNGDTFGQYWKVTTLDGTRYYFGKHKRYPGDPQATDSVQQALVYGNNVGEPCHSTVHDWWSGCYRAYRWNLDYVIDPRGNTMTYFYEKFREKYGNWNGTDAWAYDLTARLARVDYGTRAGSEGAAPAPMQVVLDRANRCSDWEGACATFPDTPWDTICHIDATSCPAHTTPAFWTPWRLAAVHTYVWNPAASAYREVDAHVLTPAFPPTMDGAQPSLWLQSVTRIGKSASPERTMPAMSFGGTLLANRVDGAAPMNHYRLSQIATGAGGHVSVVYSEPHCTPADIPWINAADNRVRCFPQWDPSINGWAWFQKYVVYQVTDFDLTGGGPDEVTQYGYDAYGTNAPALWAADTNEAAPGAYRTWSSFAGFTNVTTTRGPPGGTRSTSRKLYYRGMHGDPIYPSGTRTATITDSTGAVTQDLLPLRGKLREEQTLDGATVLAKTLHTTSLNGGGPTATRTGTWQWSTVSAYQPRETRTETATWLAASNAWWWTRKDTSYNGYGLPVTAADYGDTGLNNQPTVNTGDDRCTTTSYAAADTTKWMVDYPSQTLTTDCAPNPSGTNYLAGEPTLYDGGALGAAPTRGLVTRTNALATVSGATLTWKQDTRADHDAHGRVLNAYDALDRKTSTAYTPAVGGPLTRTVVTNPAGHAATTTLDPARGVPTLVVDPNGKSTTEQYDALGRLTKVFKPHTAPATTLPDLEYAYTIRTSGGPNTVSTKRLGPDGNQIESFELYDGRLRLRQTQAPAAQANGGRIVTDTAYDGRGLTAQTSTFWNSSAPSGASLLAFSNADVQNQHRYSYDTLERMTVDGLYSANTLKWQTTTGYDGDRSWTIPPAGGTATMTITTARGDTRELRQYTTGTPPNATGFQATTYGHDRLSELTEVTDPAGNRWANHYDLRGRLDTATDPDDGTTQHSYDDAGQLLTSTDARGVTLAYTYDSLGRQTGGWHGSTTPPGYALATWTYDTIAKGQLTSSTRWHGTDQYTTTITGYNDQYQLLGATVTLPVVPGQPSGDFTVTTAYKLDGSVASTTYPAAGGLTAETVTNGYDSTGRLLTVGGQDTYLAATTYHNFGPVYQRLLGSGTKQVRLTTAVDAATGRLTSNATDTQNQTTPSAWDNKLTEAYGYDPAGNVTSIKETNGGATVSNQCFSYDKLRQLTEAWTTTSATCQASPSMGIVGGPDSYWTSYTHDTVGNRTGETKHRSSSPDIVRTYTYPTTGQRHTLTSVTTSGGATGTDSYDYDPTGNTTTRSIAGRPGQTLTWNDEGHLATVTDTGGTTSYIYDADGNRLVSKDPGGVTVYLAGYELRTVAGATAATRYYTAGGATIASRTAAGGLTWLASDHHETGQLAINPTTLAVTRRKTDPFGNPRGTDPTWPNTRGFVGGTIDNTGLTHLGAREYDPTTGRFISDDAVTDFNDPQQINGYAYASNTPVNLADPDGLDPGGRCDLAGTCTSQTSHCVGIGYHSDACRGVVDIRSDEQRQADDRMRRYECRRFGECNRRSYGYDPIGPRKPGKVSKPAKPAKPGGPGIRPKKWVPSCDAACRAKARDLLKRAHKELDNVNPDCGLRTYCALPLGRTTGYCGAGGWGWGVYVGGEACVMSDKNGVYFTATGMEPRRPVQAWGGGVGVGISRAFSNARHKNELKGTSAFGSGGIGYVDGSYSWSPGDDGRHVGVGTIGAGVGFAGAGGESTTVVSGYMFNWCGLLPCNFGHAQE